MARGMKPLLVANFPTAVGGGELALEELAGGLVARGHRPLVAIPGPGNLARDFDRVLIPTSIPAAAVALRNLARECDVVHTTGARGIAAAGLARVGRPIIWHTRVAAPDKLDAVLQRIPDLIIANSRATAARFPGHPALKVIYNGIRAHRPAEDPYPLTPGTRAIAVIGRMTPEKGHLDLVPAAAALAASDPDVEWNFIGDQNTDDGRELAAALTAAGVRFRMSGPVPDIARSLSRFQLIVVPSRVEGFSRVAAEALRAGVTVAARNVGGLPEVLEGVTDPWLPDDTAAWADVIRRRLLHPPDAASKLKELGARFDLAVHVNAVIAEYERLIGASARRA